MYKLWTGIICHILSAYCEQHGILSDPQEGFRKHKDCQRQLQYLKLVLKDAKLHNRDLHITLLDIKSAFNSVDHDCLFRILQALGIPQDVLDIIIDLHHGASTCISTNHGKTAPVSLRRGTIQGDSLSPLLFILFLEPLVCWLQVNDRGQRCMSASSTCPHYTNALAAGDDLALMSGSSDQMQVQLNKVQAFADWCGMKLSPAKCEASAVLWGTHAANKAVLPTHWEHIQPMLEGLRVQGAQASPSNTALKVP